MKLLLTGATGFVGFNILLALLQKQNVDSLLLPVRQVEKLRNRLAAEGIFELPKRVCICNSQAPDWELPEKNLKQTTHAIHAAAILFGKDWSDYEMTNIQGTRNLLKKLPATTRCVILSSQAAGGPSASPLSKNILPPKRNETTPDAPISFYGKSKQKMESLLPENRDLIALRPPMVLGAYDTATLPLFKLAKSFIRVKPGFQTKHFSWISVDDLVQAIFICLENKNASKLRSAYLAADSQITDRDLVINAGACLEKNGVILPLPKKILQLVGTIAGVFPTIQKAVPNFAPDRISEMLADYWLVDDKIFRKNFDWQPRQDLPHALSSACAYYLRTGML
ncbi:MAG: NAD-dependent epimerase/dehydratase family protein [Chthoniobacterales bacterium]